MHVIDVPASQGLLWIKQAWAIFVRHPAIWIALLSGWLLITLTLFLIPLAGPALATMLQPVFFGGLMLAARDQDLGRPVAIAHLFAGFRVNGRALMSVGSITLLTEILILLLMGSLGLGADIPPAGQDERANLQALLQSLDGKEWIVLLGLALLLLVKGVLWFVPPLLVFHPMPVGHALRWSFFAFVSNFSALLIFGILMMLIYGVSIFPFGLGLLVSIPLFAIGNYTSFRGSFSGD